MCDHKEDTKKLINSYTELFFLSSLSYHFLPSFQSSVPPLVKHKVLRLCRNSDHKLCSTHHTHTETELCVCVCDCVCVCSVQSKQRV